jgi:quinol monooxygenase YgiN
MAKLQSLDPHTPMFAQFKETTGPIVLANTFVVPKERTESFLALFRSQAEFMKAQPGFVSLQMHKGTAASHF